MGRLTQLFALLTLILPNDGVPVELQRGIGYTRGLAGPVQVDVYRPTDRPGPYPVVVLVHGGVWFAGDRTQYTDFAYRLCLEGFAVVTPDYRRLPPEGFVGQVKDLKESIRWIRCNAERLDLDPERIGLFGSSAGGHLAGLAGFSGDDEGFGADPPDASSAVQAVFLLYGLYDIYDWRMAPALKIYAMNQYPWEAPEVYRFLSPRYHIDGDEPPTAVMHGPFDVLVPYRQAVDLVGAMKDAGVDARLISYPGGHGFALLRPRTRPDAYAAMSKFFRETIGPGAPKL